VTRIMAPNHRGLVGPALSLSFAAAMAVPVAYLLYRSVSGAGHLTLSAFDDLVTGYYLKDVLLLTLGMAALSSLSATLLAYPIAYVTARSQSGVVRALLAVAVMLPLWTNVIVRVFGWQISFSSGGLVNDLLRPIGLGSVQLLATPFGVYLALTMTSIPYIVLPLVSAFETIRPSLEESAAMAGAGPWRSLFRITVPLTLPGVAAGLVLSFALNLSSFAIPSVLGGGKVRMVGLVVYEKMAVGNFQSAAALGVVLLALTGLLLLPLLYVRRIGDRLARRAR
jgi:putative spermidine/putrescine transport system permease protein